MSNVEMRSHQLMLPVQEWGCYCAVINSFFSSVTMWHPLWAPGHNQTVPFLARNEAALTVSAKGSSLQPVQCCCYCFHLSLSVFVGESSWKTAVLETCTVIWTTYSCKHFDIDWQTFRLYVCLNRFLSAKLKFLLTSQALILVSPPHPPNYCYWCCIGLH